MGEPNPNAERTGVWPARWRRLARPVLDALLPHRCLACGALVDAPGVLCPACWEGVRFIGPPACAACGLPFGYEAGEGALCGDCSRQAPPFRRARSAIVYEPSSRRLVLDFKHGDRTDAAGAYARWMVRAGAELVPDAEVVVPVPLHWTRLFARRYNQAALLAREIGRAADIQFVPDALRRARRTPSQGRLGRLARQRNVAGAFALGPRGARQVEGKSVLLVDDVMTTGATLGACARTLLAGGAAAVDVLTLARVVMPAL